MADAIVCGESATPGDRAVVSQYELALAAAATYELLPASARAVFVEGWLAGVGPLLRGILELHHPATKWDVQGYTVCEVCVSPDDWNVGRFDPTLAWPCATARLAGVSSDGNV